MKYYILLLILLFETPVLFSQQYEIQVPIIHAIEMDSMYYPLVSGMKPTLNKNIYKKPDNLFNSGEVFDFKVNTYQNFFDYKQRGLIPDSISNLIIKNRKFENIKFKNYGNDDIIAIFLFKNQSGAITVIPDINNNNDFSDDIGYLFSKKNRSSNEIVIPNVHFTNIDYDLGNGNKTVKFNAVFDIKISINLDSLEQSKIRMHSKDKWTGKISLENNILDFHIDLIAGGLDFFNDATVSISYGNTLNIKEYDVSEKVFYRKSIDTMLVNGAEIILDNVSPFGDTAYFTIIKNNESFSPIDYIASLVAKNIKTLEVEKLFKKGEVIVLDFWATWCGPCIEQHKVLKEIYKAQDYPKPFVLKGILFDKPENIEKANKYLQDSDLGWENFFINPKEYNRDFNLLKITSLPTYLVVDADLKVLLRTNSLDTLLKFIR